LEANPSYAHTKHGNDREDTVSTSRLRSSSKCGYSQMIPTIEVGVPANITDEEASADADQRKLVNEAEPD